MSDTGELRTVASRTWAEVLHAEVGARLTAARVPYLHIKGPTVATWLYEPGERLWGDVDILVPPSRMDDALEVLVSAGFAYRDPGLRWDTGDDHALTLVYDPSGQAGRKAAAEIDVHHRFIGIDADPERAFAELWRRREPGRLAALDVWFPDVTTRALLVVLNVARDPHGGKGPRDLARLLSSATDADWARTIALARRVGALEALRAGLELADEGRQLVARTSLAQVTVSPAVRLRAEGSSRTAVRIQELRAYSPWKKVRMLVAWVVPPPAVIRMREPQVAGSPWRMAGAYLRRYRQGARELRESLRRTPRSATPVATAPLPVSTVASTPPDPDQPPETSAGTVADVRLRGHAVADSDGQVALLVGEPGELGQLPEALVERGWTMVAEGMTVLDAEHLEVRATGSEPTQPFEVRWLVVPTYDEGSAGVVATQLSYTEVAAVGEDAGWAAAVRARLARRVTAHRLRYAEVDHAVEELDRVWREPVTPVLVVRDHDPVEPTRPGSYRRPAYVGAARDEYQVVLLDLRNGTRHILSPTGSAIWETLTATGSLQETVAELQEAFPDTPSLTEDATAFVESLETQGLVERG